MPQSTKSSSSEDQPDLFDGVITENDLLWRAHAELKETYDRTRRRLFHEIKDLREQLVCARADIDRLVYREKASDETEAELEVYK